VLTSCRGTQLANDATVENGTSYFTQHLVDGLLGEAADRDQDGFVDFSDLYSYVDRRLREENKQIPQRRVDGDGDLRLAKRPPRAPAVLAASEPIASAATVATAGGARPRSTVPVAAAAGTAPPSTGSRWTRRRTVIAALAGAVVVAGAVVATVMLSSGGGSGGGSGGHASPGHGSYTASGPWRIRIDGTAYGSGCTVTLRDASGTQFDLPGSNIYEIARYQVPQAGAFTWTTTDRSCLVTPLPGMGKATLPFTQEENGHTDVFAAPPNGVSVHIVDNKDSNCTLRLFNANGQELDYVPWERGDGDLTLETLGAASVYVFDDNCVIRLSAHT
jgi:hypothetical protein